MSVGERFHLFLDFTDGRRFVEIDLQQAQRSIQKVDVAVGESRQDEMLLSIDHVGRRAAIGSDLLRATHGNHFVSADSQRFRPGLARIDGIDARIHDHGVRD